MEPAVLKKTVLQIGALLCLACAVIACWFMVTQFLKLPFRTVNDTLHKNESAIVLDFLIPGGTYIEETTSIGDVIKIRYAARSSFYERSLKSLTEMIPTRYRYTADLTLFLFWSFLYMTFFRVFTFMGYGRALRTSLFFGGCTYYFMPDFSSGRIDDITVVSVALTIIIGGYYIRARKKLEKP